MFCALDLNRKNINRYVIVSKGSGLIFTPSRRAISDNMLPELGMNTKCVPRLPQFPLLNSYHSDFNYGNTIFLVSFLSAELPSGLISKKLGADRWVPFLIVAWSIVSASQAALHSRAAFFATRCILGLLMGGFIPGLSLRIRKFMIAQIKP